MKLEPFIPANYFTMMSYLFVCGNHPLLTIKNTKIAIGICYETLQREHFVNANRNGAKIYIASVAKIKAGIEKANVHFPKMAKEF
ncbi:MAG: hypothetical protein R2728_02275 [Chitinophagales bacterium]